MKISRKKFKQKLKSIIKKYIKLLKLKEWHIDILLSNDKMISFCRGNIKNKAPDFYAEVIYNYLTQSATITLTKLQTVNEHKELDNTILHELLHIKFSPLLQVVESLVAISGLAKEKSRQLIYQIDEHEHELVNLMIKLINNKNGEKNGK